MKLFPVELHTHTHHSDGSFRVRELCEEAQSLGYSALAITDHNTYAGYEEVKSNSFVDELNLFLVKGIEWTTFHGHFLVYGQSPQITWTDVLLNNIHQVFEQLHHNGNLITIAHPFDVGSPICTGCAWDYQLEDYSYVNEIEIWNSENPHLSFSNEKAYNFWLVLLDQGYQIACTCGRDWHGASEENDRVGIKYIETEDKLDEERLEEAIRNGRSFISLGPVLKWHLTSQGKRYHMGDKFVISSALTTRIDLTILPAELKHLSHNNYQNLTVKIFNNRNCIFKKNYPGNFDKSYQETLDVNNLEKGYLRIEIQGNFKGDLARLVISNPIYLYDSTEGR